MALNASLILGRWGFDQVKTRPTSMTQSCIFRCQSLELEKRNLFDVVDQKIDHRMASYHRVDVHNGLRKLGEARCPVSTRLGAAIIGLNCETRTLRLANGSCVRDDLVIVADSIQVVINVQMTKPKLMYY